MLWKKQPVGSKIADLTSKFKVTDLGSFASESALATGLSTKIGTMTNGEVAFIQFQMSAATTNFGALAYVGTLTRVAAIYASFSVSVTTSGYISHTVVGSMNNGTWKMEQVALNSNTTLYNLGEGTKSEMESALVTTGDNMKVNVQGVRFGITSVSSPFQSTTYLGKLMRYSSGRYVVQANGITSSNQDIIGVYRNSTWYWTSINSNLATKVPYQSQTTDADTFSDGITIVSSTSNVAHLPTTSRCAVLQLQLYNNPVRKLQYAFVLDDREIYVRAYAGSWDDWKSYALSNSLTPQAFNPTANTACINVNYQGTTSCYKIGKLCMVSIVNFRFGNIPAAGTTIFSNMPSAVQYVRTRAYTTAGKEFLVTTNGTNLIASTAPLATGEDYTLEFSYVCS